MRRKKETGGAGGDKEVKKGKVERQRSGWRIR
jgi:hypothetical protein